MLILFPYYSHRKWRKWWYILLLCKDYFNLYIGLFFPKFSVSHVHLHSCPYYSSILSPGLFLYSSVCQPFSHWEAAQMEFLTSSAEVHRILSLARSLCPGQRCIPHKGKKSLVSPARTSEMGARPGSCVGGYGESRAGRLWHREDTVKISTSGHSLASAFLSSFCSSCFPTSPIQAFPELRAPNATKRHFTAHATHSQKSSSDVMKQARLATCKSPKYLETDTISSCDILLGYHCLRFIIL